MPRLRLAFGLVAATGVASIGCTLDGAESCCPTDARRIAYSCGEEAVRKGPCGPNEAYYGHHPTCWGSWPEGWERYKADYCVTTAAIAECDCEEGAATEPAAARAEPELVEAAPVEINPLDAEQVDAVPVIDSLWPDPALPEPVAEPITPQPPSTPEPQPAPEPIRPVTPAPALLTTPPKQALPAPTLPAPEPPSIPETPAPAAAPRFEPPPSRPSASTSQALPTYEDLLRKRPVKSTTRPVFGPPPASDSVRRY